jgi:hypothetical protein
MAKKKYLKIADSLRYDLKRVKGTKTILVKNKKTGIREKKTVGIKNLYIKDKQTGKRVPYTKFQKIFDLTKSELLNLKKNSVNDSLKFGELNKFFQHFNGSRNFEFQLDTTLLSEIEKYRIRANNKFIPFNVFEDKILSYVEQLERSFYKFLIHVNVINGIAYLDLTGEILRRQFELNKNGTLNTSLVDKNKNFILWNS